MTVDVAPKGAVKILHFPHGQWIMLCCQDSPEGENQFVFDRFAWAKEDPPPAAFWAIKALGMEGQMIKTYGWLDPNRSWLVLTPGTGWTIRIETQQVEWTIRGW